MTKAGGEKTMIRRELLRRRRALGMGEWRQKSSAIEAVVKDLPVLRSTSKVHCYVSMEAEREVSTTGLLEWLASERKMVYMPYIDHGRMVAAKYLPGQRFSFPGNAPPVPDPLVTSDEAGFDLVIVPLAGTDRLGRRIGYGKGWYDRFFERLASLGEHPLRIGLAFGFQVLDVVPCEPWDQHLDMVVTETGIINCIDGSR
ncbi:MAG: 5-formyltetrahydrofolate cyclo-ligase [Chlorobiaceae bacterium]|nr:5-formyltetrahydrofolate cyclo-ligase [Chlorobiaceae bacterium]